MDNPWTKRKKSFVCKDFPSNRSSPLSFLSLLPSVLSRAPPLFPSSRSSPLSFLSLPLFLSSRSSPLPFHVVLISILPPCSLLLPLLLPGVHERHERRAASFAGGVSGGDVSGGCRSDHFAGAQDFGDHGFFLVASREFVDRRP